MTILIKNATIVTCDPGRTIYYDAALVVENDRISNIGPTSDIEAKYSDAEVVDGLGKAVFPGFNNCHTHLLKTVNRGILEDFGFPTTLQFPVDTRALMTQNEANVFGLLGALESIRSGVTCVLEIEHSIQEYVESLDSTGLRLILAEYVSDVDGERMREGVYEYPEQNLERAMQDSIDLIEKWHGRSNGRVTCFMGPDTPETCSPQMLRRSREMAEKYDIGYTIHLSESYLEIEAVMRVRGVRPTHYLFSSDLLGPRMVAAHCRYVDASEIALLGWANAGVSNNPAIAARRGAAAPAKELIAAGCKLGIGSDNMSEDMVEAMRTGLFAERVRRNDQMDPQPEDVLDWAAIGGSRVLGMSDQTGSLEVGKKADFFMIDMMRPHLVPTLSIVSSFVHQGQPSDITHVMVDGNWLMQDSKVLTIDEGDIVRRAEEAGHAVWQRMIERYPNVPFPVELPPDC